MAEKPTDIGDPHDELGERMMLDPDEDFVIELPPQLPQD